MRVLRLLILSITFFAGAFATEFANAGDSKAKYDYQSDVARLRKIVINSLYSHRDIFLRELISNSNDALEKLRLTALKDKSLWDGSTPLNITIRAVQNQDGTGGQLIITDTGIGMTPEELTTNLGTLAKSGTADFLARAEDGDGQNTGNLIGAFGLGFYSSFLVADQVYVSSIAPKSKNNPNPTQYVFSSNSEENSFEIFPDPRGNSLGRGTEITLVLKDDAAEFLDGETLATLINKHSSFASGFPIYLHKQVTKEVPEEEGTPLQLEKVVEDDSPADENTDEALVEDVKEEKEGADPPPKMKTVVVEEWAHLNAQPPLWQRIPKDISHLEYNLFYQATFKDFKDPLAYHHFSGDADGVAFKGIIYIPAQLDDDFWNNVQAITTHDVRLMVKRVFITSNLGVDALPKWASWVKAVVDADDLPLNVSRETLQSTRFLKQIRQVILKHLIQLFARLAVEDKEKFAALQASYGTVLKLGTVEDSKNRDKLAALTRFSTNQRNSTSLDEYLENKKHGQKQIFYLAEVGKSTADLAKSVFVEKLHARGYEVLLAGEAIDEILFSNLRQWKRIPFQDVAKAGLKFGDEEQPPAEQKEQQQDMTQKYKPLLDWLKAEADGVVRDVVISNRLVTSPCAVVADVYGYTANVEKLMGTSNKKQKDMMHEIAKKAKVLEINPKSPLIDGLLRRVEQLPSEENDRDHEAEAELREVASILIDSALVRSGFDVPDSNGFFSRVDKVLRRSLGVSETAPTDTTVEPAPPIDPTLLEEHEENQPKFFDASSLQYEELELPEELKQKVSLNMEEEVLHEEL